MFINDNPVTIDGNGLVQLTAQQSGPIVAKAVAIDLSGNRTETITTIQVLDPTDTDAPEIDLDLSGITDGVITAPTQIRGTVTDTNFDYYVLEVAPLDGSAGFKEVFRGNAIVSDGILGTFDPSLLQNDTYTLRLTAYDTNGQGTTTESAIAVAGELKLGNFRLSFTDLTIPVTGIPITVTRTYDTLTSNNTDDFGYGWRMEFRDTDLRTSLGKDEQYELFGIKSKGFKEDTRVYITLPGGKREAFTFKPTINRLSGFLGYAASQGGVNGFDTNLYNPAFEADKGVTSTLSVRNPESSGNMLSRNLDTGMFRNLGGQLYDPADPYFGGIYVLTTKEGIEYEIDGQTGDLMKVTDTNGNVLTFSDTEIKSSTGQQVIFERDAQNRITSVVDPMGNKVSYEYDVNGDLVGVTDREGNTTKFEYSEENPHYLEEVINPLGNSGVRTEYNDQGRLTKTIDASGNAIEMVYDSTNQILTVKDGLGNPTTFEYDDRGNVLTEVDALGGIIRRTFDENNNLLSYTDALDRTTVYTYDSKNNLTAVTDAGGNITRYSFNQFDQITSMTDALGNTVQYTYTPQGNRRTFTNALGASIRYQFDQEGRPMSLRDTEGNITNFEYDESGQLTRTTDALGNETNYTYDGNGHQISQNKTVTTSEGIQVLTTSWTYDISETDRLGHTTQFTFDVLNRLTETIYADGTRHRSTYDAVGNVISQTDQMGYTQQFAYDANNRLVGVTDALNQRTSCGYDLSGNMIEVKDANNNSTHYEFDALNRRSAIILPLGQRSQMVYDVVGNLQSTTDFNGQTTTFAYDSLNRLSQKQFEDSTNISYTYTATSKIQSITDGRGVTTYAYDAQDRLLSRIDPDRRSIQYAYDIIGNLVEITTARGTTEYSYDDYHRLVNVQDADDGSTRYSYDNGNNLIRTDFENGTIEKREYDLLNRLTFLEHSGASEVLESFRYTLDANGNRTLIQENNGRQTVYSYDSLNRMTQESLIDSVLGNLTTSYTYDPVGNRLSRNSSIEGLTTYVYNQNDQLLSETENGVVTAYTYDANGNMLIQTNLDKDVIYIWDNQNRLIGTITNASDGQHEANYLYDADGIRVVSVIDGIKTRYLVDTNRPYAQVLEEYDSNGDILTSYVYGHRLISQERNGDRSFYHPDGLGSIRVLTDETGQVTDTYAYDAYGKLLNVTGDTQNSYLYTGEQYDTVTDSYYLRARYYNPEMGRFLSSDPFEGWLTDPLSLTNYSYVHGNPVNATDPSGLFTMTEQTATRLKLGELSAKTYPALKTTTTISKEVLPAATTQASPALANVARASISIGTRIAIDVARATMDVLALISDELITENLGIPIIYWGEDIPETKKHTYEAITGTSFDFFLGFGRASAFLGRISPEWKGSIDPDWKKDPRKWLDKVLDKRPDDVRDEYPYNSTIPGGAFFYFMNQVSVRYVPNYEQTRNNPSTGAKSQAVKLRTFYDDALVKADDPANMWFGVSVTASQSFYTTRDGLIVRLA